MMLFHILMSVSDHELMLDNFLLTASVNAFKHNYEKYIPKLIFYFFDYLYYEKRNRNISRHPLSYTIWLAVYLFN